MAPQLTGAGNRFTQLLFLDGNDGMPIGGTSSAPAAGTSTNGGAIFLPATKNANRTIPDPENTIVTGEDGEVRHQYDWTTIASRGFPIELSAEDLVQYGLIQNMPVTNFIGGQFTYDDISNVNLPNMMAILQSRMKRLADGIDRWGGVVIPAGTVRVMGRAGFNERGAALYRLYITPQPSNYNQFGYTILDSSSAQKAAGGIVFNNLPYPVTAHAYKGNAVATQFTLDKAIVSASYAEAATERVTQAIASVVATSPFSVTFSAAPASGKRGIIWYGFQP